MKLKLLVDNCGWPFLARMEVASLFGWSLKLHIFLRSDADEELHDHPWSFFSLVLAGKYFEQTEKGLLERKPWRIAFRPAKWRHRVILPTYPNGAPVPCATLVLTAPVSREWGFWRRGQFIPWKEFVSSRRCE
jgi:hypothetical protein